MGSIAHTPALLAKVANPFYGNAAFGNLACRRGKQQRTDRGQHHYRPISRSSNEPGTIGARPRPPAGGAPKVAAATKSRCRVASRPRLREPTGVVSVCTTR